MSRNVPRIEMPKSEENEFATLSLFSPSRAPLNSIPDPSQLQKANHLPDFDLVQKLEGTRTRTLGSEKRFEVLEASAGNASSMHDSNPKTVGRNGKSRSEPNSAQSTPTRNGVRVSLGGGCATGARALQSFGGRGTSSFSRIPRGISMVDPVSFSEATPHFELDEDHSFWKEHNVQVLIRLRPLSTMERATQGHGRCLKQESPQTLVWLGHPETRFTFDHVASETISQEKLFHVAGLPMVENCLSGYNSCVFAYGQTGSGKTYTMMGEISDAEGSLGEDCGVTARIFEHLFSRIKFEEEGRRDERLKFNCKCSFLEIYNEQITDLLEPSSTNLQLREDLGKGVYVENLVECNVRTVSDVLKLLLQGAMNRKIAVTRMNSESSRSHSVFTCTIESLWERDSLTHSRFARLNLVDLAGSERQKSSGAEGDRLKEAANINKSLSTLGLVIMSLVDLAHGKHRHVPYRDSRLTFLLQDSLGGNSKTMIIANVSPSLCSLNETLSTLKFAQRAKLIQNDAKVNEDASGDVTALQQEIRKLKYQLSSLMKNHNSCGLLLDCVASLEDSRCSATCEEAEEITQDKCHLQVKKMKDNLIGALRSKNVSETALQKCEVETEHMECLVREMEEDAKCINIKLNLRQDKVGELVNYTSGSLISKESLIEEDKSLKGEIKLLRASIDKNQELTRLTLENTKLREQLRQYHKFYDHGEREAMLAEVTGLHDQLLDIVEAKEGFFSNHVMKENELEKEFKGCRNMNSSLSRELNEIQVALGRYLKFDQTQSESDVSSTSEADQVNQAHKHSMAEKMPTISESREEVAIPESKSSTNIIGVSGIPDGSMKMRTKKGRRKRESIRRIEGYETELSGLVNNRDALVKTDDRIDDSILQLKLEKVITDLEEARTLNCQYEKQHKSQISQQEAIEVVREQVETETARTILELQEEVIALQSEFQRRNCKLTEENQSMKDTITVREAEIRALNQDWEKATLELTNFIVDGSKSIKDASTQIENIICSFPQVNLWIGDHVEKAAKNCMRKEETILLLQKSLEDAKILLAEMDLKLNSLKGATLALNDFQLGGNPATTEEAFCLNNDIDRVSNKVDPLESDLKAKQHSRWEAERHVEVACAITKWLSDSRNQPQMLEKVKDQSVKKCGTLSSISASPSAEGNADISLSKDGYLSEATCKKGDELSTSSSDFSNCIWQNDCSLNVECQRVSSSESDARIIYNIATSTDLIGRNGSAHCVYCGAWRQSVEKPLTLMMEKAETECKHSNELSSERYMCLMQRMDPARSFFDRFEEVNATMKEADLTLCELVKANEKSKHFTGMWLPNHEELMVKEKNLINDLEQVKSTLSAYEQENQISPKQTHSALADLENSVSLLEEYFLETKRGVEETLEGLFSHVVLAGKELCQLISNSRPSLEQILSETMEREFTMYATYQCHIGKLIDQILDQRLQFTTPHFAEEERQQSVKITTIGYNDEDKITGKQYRSDMLAGFGIDVVVQSHENLLYENLYLKKELERKEALFEGLLFDFRLLQESASNNRDIKNEMDELFAALCKVHKELELKASQVHDLFVHNENLEICSTDLKTALLMSKSDLEQAKERIQIFAEQNEELRVLLSDLYRQKVAAEEGLDEQKDLVKRLEKEILHLTTTAETQLLSAVKCIEENLKKTSDEKDQLVEEICALNAKLQLAYVTADEKEAIATEARQESEASKIYAEQKEEEVKILEISVEELERTINILEKWVYDMDEEIKRHHTTQDSLETELQALRLRLCRFENFTGTVVRTHESPEEHKSQISMSVELQDAPHQIQVLQKEITEQTKEIKQLKEYISEILLHSEAQSLAYQEKYKTLEVMIRDFKLDDPSLSATETISHKTEKGSLRSRGSSSPFRCIVGLVQQMKLEKDQELTMARVRVEELESLLAVKQKEVCTLNTRIAAADSMTHDVIRDLLGVKMDITSYAELIDQHQVQRVVVEAQQHAEEILFKEQEIINLKGHIDSLVEERESCMSELHKKDTDVLATQISLDQLQERVQLLSMQNEMLNNDKSNLLRNLAELDQTGHSAWASNHRAPQTTKDTSPFKLADTYYTKRLENAQKLLSHANNELAKYRKTSNNHSSTKLKDRAQV